MSLDQSLGVASRRPLGELGRFLGQDLRIINQEIVWKETLRNMIYVHIYT